MRLACEIFDTTDNKYNFVETLLFGIINKHLPVKQMRVRPKNVPYMTKEWKRLYEQGEEPKVNTFKNGPGRAGKLKEKLRMKPIAKDWKQLCNCFATIADKIDDIVELNEFFQFWNGCGNGLEKSKRKSTSWDGTPPIAFLLGANELASPMISLYNSWRVTRGV